MLNKQELPDRQEDFQTNQESKWQVEHERLNQLKDRLDDITREAFKEQRPLTTEEITQIKNELKNIKGLVINFDETITIEKTFTDFLKSFTEDDLLEASRTWEDFTESKKGFKATLSDKNASPVQFFYNQCLKGISRETIERRLEELVSKLTINPNSLEVFDILRKVKDIELLPLLVLSRNNDLMLKAFYNHPKFKQALTEHGVEVIGIIGNQIKFDEAGRVNGIAEHVTKENKQAYIAAGNMLIVDNDETKENLESGVNAINVQGERFKPEFVGEMIVTSDLMECIEQLKKDEEELKNAIEIAKKSLVVSLKHLDELITIDFVKSVDLVDNSILVAQIMDTERTVEMKKARVMYIEDKLKNITNELIESNRIIQSLLNKRLENEK